jgi:hypothetical protein
MDHVFATESRLVSHPRTGVTVAVNIGEHWSADDPVVAAYPQFFTDDARYGLRSSVPLGEDGYPASAKPRATQGATETATAAPGEKRSRK